MRAACLTCPGFLNSFVIVVFSEVFRSWRHWKATVLRFYRSLEAKFYLPLYSGVRKIAAKFSIPVPLMLMHVLTFSNLSNRMYILMTRSYLHPSAFTSFVCLQYAKLRR
jgi:hypothetical protein